MHHVRIKKTLLCYDNYVLGLHVLRYDSYMHIDIPHLQRVCEGA